MQEVMKDVERLNFHGKATYQDAFLTSESDIFFIDLKLRITRINKNVKTKYFSQC